MFFDNRKLTMGSFCTRHFLKMSSSCFPYCIGVDKRNRHGFLEGMHYISGTVSVLASIHIHIHKKNMDNGTNVIRYFLSDLTGSCFKDGFNSS